MAKTKQKLVGKAHTFNNNIVQFTANGDLVLPHQFDDGVHEVLATASHVRKLSDVSAAFVNAMKMAKKLPDMIGGFECSMDAEEFKIGCTDVTHEQVVSLARLQPKAK